MEYTDQDIIDFKEALKKTQEEIKREYGDIIESVD